jgi:FkbM family methyltransferase
LLVRGIYMFRDWDLWILNRFGLLRKRGVGKFRLRNGIAFALDFSRHNVGTFQEVWLMDLYEKKYSIRPGDVVVDIGASFGPFAVLAAGKGAHVYAYEPTPRSFRFLKKNTQGRSVNPRNLAVAEKRGKIKMFESKDGDEGNSPFYCPRMKAEPFEAYCVTLDDIMSEIGHCNFLKMDCEGYELPILESASTLALNSIDNIALEYHGNGLELANLLEKAGFKTELFGTDNGYLYASRQIK